MILSPTRSLAARNASSALVSGKVSETIDETSMRPSAAIRWVLGAAAGAGAAVPAVALNAASGLVPDSWKRIGTGRARQARWVLYAVLGA
ncbi:MAG TPA: hypothetical protein VIJ07_25950, partial [Dermatophilaceae bacterium]